MATPRPRRGLVCLSLVCHIANSIKSHPQSPVIVNQKQIVNPVNKALWFIESHFTQEITLDDIAQIAGISRFHMSRAFSSATGYSVTTYVRGRRQTQAAHALATGAPDIFTVASKPVTVRTKPSPAPSAINSATPPRPSGRKATPKTSNSWSQSK